MEENMQPITEDENNQNPAEVLETVEFTIIAPATGTIITCKDPSGVDQSPVPEIISKSDKYFIDTVCVNGTQRLEAYWKSYSTLVYYSDEKIEKGKSYTVFGKVKAAPGYIFYDPVCLIINGDELSCEEVEDYSLEGDSFTFYYDLKIL